jgi:hypothetical protein
MDMPILFLLVFFGFVLLGISFYVRTKSENKYELKSIDVALLLLPVVFFLFFTGKIGKVNLFGVELETASVIVDAAKQPIESQIIQLEGATIDDMVRSVEMGAKGGVERIPELIERKTEALLFQLGFGGYWGPAIQEYFESLSAAAYLKHVLINDDQGRLYGFLDARELMNYFIKQGDNGYNDFAQWLNHPNERSLQALTSLPSFVSGDNAVDNEQKKRQVLQTMDERNVTTLPVVNPENRFVGIVERSRILASLMLEIFDKLEDQNTQ